MKFEKQVMFLGMECRLLQDNRSFYVVSFFSPADNAPVQVNVVDSNKGILERLAACKCGQMINAVFLLRQTDKLYKLALYSV